VEAVAAAIETVVEAVAEVVSDVVETVGTLVWRVVEAIGAAAGGIPLIGPSTRTVLQWLATLLSAVFRLGSTLVRAVLDVVAGSTAGFVRVLGGAVGGLLAWDSRLLVKGAGGVVSSIVGPLLVLLANGLAVVQAALSIHMGERALTKEERDLLWRVFRGSVALHNVRIVEGFAGVFSLNDRPFTLGNTIYLKRLNPSTRPDVLIHECAHVWQYQHLGTRYASDALWAQRTVPSAYSWEAELARGRSRWQDFNTEAQAQFVQDLWLRGNRGDPARGPGGFYVDDPVNADVEFVNGGFDRTSLAVEAVAHLRGSFRPRLSALL
jgi:hypothetical protein